jgi:TRAP transporter TAXI family solute receptor
VPRIAVPLLLLTTVVLASGCRRGPAEQDLQADLQAGLDGDYRDGLFQVERYSRKGVYPYEAEGDERQRLLVYYDAELAFVEDHQLTDRDVLGVGTLLGVLGATSMGVDGVNPDGNRAGDTLAVFGAAPYARDGERWVRITEAPSPPRGEVAVTAPGDVHEELDLTPRQRQLRRLEGVGTVLDRRGDPDRSRRFDRDLERFVASTECSLAADEGRPSLATGLPFGEYARLGNALATLLEREGRATCVLPTDGSAENCRRVAAGDVDFGLAQGDVVAAAHGGTGSFAGEPALGQLRAVCALYPEAVQLLVRPDGGLTRLEELRGKRVGLGPDGSGTRISALQVLAAGGITPRELARADALPTGEALAALADGELDALFVTSAWPLASLTDHAVRHGLILLSLPDTVVDALAHDQPALVPQTLPANTYPGQGLPCRTVAATSLLISRADVPKEQVQAVLEALYGNVDELAGQTSHAWYISRERATTGAAIPLHPAAESYLGGSWR